MGAIRSATPTVVRLAGALLLVTVLAAGLMAPDRASAATTFAAGDAVVTTDLVNVRTKPGTSATIREVAVAGRPFTIGTSAAKKANGYTWYRVSTATQANYGWIASDFLALDLPFEEGDFAVVIDGSLNLRSKAGTGASVVAVLADGAGVSVLGNAPVKANGFLWYRVVSNGKTGWVASEFLLLQNGGEFDDDIEVGATVRVFDGPLNAREEPDTSADVLQVLADEEIGVVTDGPVEADGYTWYEFRNFGVVDAWVVADFIVADPDVSLCEGQGPCVDLEIGDLFTVNTDALNVRKTAGLDGAIVDVAAFGASGERLVGSPQVVDDLIWVKVRIPNVGTGWVVLDYLTETEPA